MSRIEIRTDSPITTQDAATVTPDDAYRLHEWVNIEPSDLVTVVVMDTGIHPDSVANHPWFDGVSKPEYVDAIGAGLQNDAVGHGTGIASIYGKIVPNVELIDLRIFDESGGSSWETIERAYDWLLDNADRIDIVNMSWGTRQNIPEINTLHDRLTSAGVHDIVAAGNTGAEGGSPATAKTAFSAGAITADGEMTRFSSYNPDRENPDVAAVGKNVKMARAPGTSMGRVLDTEFVKASGTSFAAPYIGAAYATGLAAEQTSWDGRFEQTAHDIPGTERDAHGILQVTSAFKQAGVGERTSARSWSFIGNDTIYISEDWVSGDISEAVLLADDEDGTTIRFE